MSTLDTLIEAFADQAEAIERIRDDDEDNYVLEAAAFDFEGLAELLRELGALLPDVRGALGGALAGIGPLPKETPNELPSLKMLRAAVVRIQAVRPKLNAKA